MPLDTSIALRVNPIQTADPVNQLARVMQVQGMQQDAQMNRLRMDEYQRGVNEQNALARLMSDPANYKDGRFDVEGAAPKLYQAAPTKAAGVLKGFADQRKADADYRKTVLEEVTKRTELAGQAFGAVRQNPTLENIHATLDHLGQSGVFDPQKVAHLKSQVNPQNAAAFADQMFRMALGAKEQLVKESTRDAGGTVETRVFDPVTGQVRTVDSIQKTATPGDLISSQDRRAVLGETIRHHKAMEGHRASEIANQSVTYEKDANGNIVALPKKPGAGPIQATPVIGADGKPLSQGGGGKPLTDAQAKANLFGTRMQESHRILTDLEGKYSPMAVNTRMAAADAPIIGGVAGAIANVALSKEGQMAEQAQRDFINAVLRRESGAVISKEEFANGQKQYFPQPGDSAEVLEQKRRNREMAIRGLEVEVPGGFRTSAKPAAPAQQGGAPGVVDFGSLQ